MKTPSISILPSPFYTGEKVRKFFPRPCTDPVHAGLDLNVGFHGSQSLLFASSLRRFASSTRKSGISILRLTIVGIWKAGTGPRIKIPQSDNRNPGSGMPQRDGQRPENGSRSGGQGNSRRRQFRSHKRCFYDRDQPQPTGVSSYFINVAPNPAQIDLKTAVIAV